MTFLLTYKHFYTQKLLHTDAFTYEHLYTKKILITDTFTHRHLYTQTLLHTDILFLSDIFTSFPLSYISRYTPLRSRAIRRLVLLNPGAQVAWDFAECFFCLGKSSNLGIPDPSWTSEVNHWFSAGS